MAILTLGKQRQADDARELEREEKKRRRAMGRQLKRDSSAFQRIIVDRLTQMEICFRPRSGRRGQQDKLQKVRFLEGYASPEAIYLRVDTRRLPRGVRTVMLANPETLDDLSYACRHTVRVKRSVRGGFWYIVDRQEGVHGVPRLIRYGDLFAMLPQTAGPLVVPIGAGENQKLKYASLSDMTHILVGGATGAGKSVWVNALLCTLIQRNTPTDLRVTMVDLKGGVELAPYKAIPHLLQPIITRRDGVIPALEMMYSEVERRLSLFEGVCRDIGGWNYQHRTEDKRLPYWLLVIDELANVMLDKSLKSETERLLADIAARGRAPGVFCLVATQRPSVNVVTGLIKANFPTRVAFSCADMASSRTILDTSEAYGLAPAGRMIFYMGAKKQELQGPLLTDRQVDDIVSLALAGDVIPAPLPGHDVTPQEVFAYALENFDGACPYRKLYAAFKDRGLGEPELRQWLADAEGSGLDIGGNLYEMQPGRPGRARCLAPVNVDDDEEELEDWKDDDDDEIDIEGDDEGEDEIDDGFDWIDFERG